MSQMFYRYSIAVLALGTVVVVAACLRPSVPRHEATTEETPAPPNSAVVADARLKKGMAYADLREIVVAGGWKPLIDPACEANVVGTDYRTTCKNAPESVACHICDDLPELSSCSGDAYCGMHFSRGPERLHVVAYGDFSDWNAKGDKSQFSVSEWSFAK